jgi:hypothetical protein
LKTYPEPVADLDSLQEALWEKFFGSLLRWSLILFVSRKWQ